MANEEELVDYLKRVSADLYQTRRRLQDMEDSAHEPIAVVGMGCRFPGGVNSPQDLWELTSEGRDAISGFPTNRGWDLDGLFHEDPDHPGTSYTRSGGFLYDADQFDADFFNISHREAQAMDPQQRLLLEVAWEALEAAGIDPGSETVSGSNTGVFAGVSAHDYGPRATHAPAEYQGYLLSGSSGSVASGRIAYTLGLQGPTMTVDTACSSSLVAVHLACRALRNGECDMALAGGAAVLPTPAVFLEFSRQRGLAEDGRCKAFAAEADGTGWAEGAGLIVLQRLSDAQAQGRNILAVIPGSAVNQDGASSRLTAPNGPAQERVIQQALADARLTADQVDAVEAHGTGTTLGDPIEAHALLNTYGQHHTAEQPLHLGSLKSNIGHAQAAAGIGGIIKMVQALNHDELPPTLHADNPSPHIDWTTGHVSLLTKATPWPKHNRPRNAAVSAFGVSGTNAHLILQQAPTPTTSTAEEEAPQPPAEHIALALSAKTPTALAAQAARLHDHLRDHPDTALAPTAHALTTRSVFTHRAVITTDDRDEALTALTSLAEGTPHPALATGRATPAPGETTTGKTAFLFPGQGCQYPGMGSGLLASSDAFRSHIAACELALAPYVDWSLTDVLLGAEGAPSLERVDVVQPALFAVMTGLARHWEAHGVRPDAVLGHSQGEIAAAHVAGALDLDDAMRIIALRSRAITALEGRGGMASLPLGTARVTELLAPWEGRVGVAAVNGPAATVISGDIDALDAFLAHCAENDIPARRIAVSYASHSHHIDELHDQLLAELADIRPRPARIPFYSTVTGARLDTAELTPEYWIRNLRRPVRLEATTRALLGDGFLTIIESSPHAVLTPAVQDTIDARAEEEAEGAAEGEERAAAAAPTGERAAPVPPLVTGTLHRDRDDHQAFLGALAKLHTHHHTLDWSMGVGRNSGGPGLRLPLSLPTYAFQRRSYWLTASTDGVGSPTALGQAAAGHPMLGAVLDLPDRHTTLFTGQISLTTHPWLTDHTIHDTPLLPATAILDLTLHAATHLGHPHIDELTLHTPLTLTDNTTYDLRLLATQNEPDGTGRRELTFHSRAHDDEEWTHHATASLSADAPQSTGSQLGAGAEAWPPPGAAAAGLDGFYETLDRRGYHYGPRFQGLTAAWRDGDDLYAEVSLPDAADTDGAYVIHPALLDAALHPLALHPDNGTGGETGTALPYVLEGVTLHSPQRPAIALRVRLTRTGEHTLTLTTAHPDGTPYATIGGVTLRPRATPAPSTPLHRVAWTERPAPPAVARPAGLAWLALSSDGHPAATLVPDDGRYADLTGLAAALDGGTAVPDHVLAPLTVGTGARHGGAHETHEVLVRVLGLLREWLVDDRYVDSHLVLLTQHAVTVHTGENPDPAQASLWGLIRTAQTEHPDRITVIDLDTHPDTLAALPHALTTDEPHLAVRQGTLHTPRLTRLPSPTVTPPADASAWRLDLTRKGSFDGVTAVEYPEATEQLGAGEVRVEVRAAGLNFRDVLVTLDMVPGQEGVIGEGAGIVTEVGPEVRGLTPGDRVMGMFSQGIGPVAVTDQHLLARMPDAWSYVQAAAAPVAYLTAYEALKGRVSAGESMLVHTATGGVGTAALHLARHWGVEVYATASPHKWHALRDLSIDDDRIASSRTLGFEDEFRQRTAGRGVDVVLNSLADDAIDASLRLLADGGRFIEMGKTDIRDARQVAAAHPGVDYRVYDLTQTAPERIHELLTELTPLFDSGALLPPPVSTFPIGQAREALRHLSRARHIGKVVLSVAAPVRTDGTVLITGGTGVLGSLTARHLVTRHGIRHLLLASRSGQQAPGATQLADSLRELGADVTITACDTADPDQLTTLLNTIPTQHPLRAVIHTAGVIQDATITTLTPDQLNDVLHPKADAAWNLHHATRHLDLDAFILYSSLSGTLGAPGQANYAAANASLDALAHHRQALGLPGTSLAWGLWAEHSGMTGHLTEADVARITRSGFPPLATDDALAFLDAALATTEPAPVLARVSPPALRALARDEALPPLLRDLVRVPVPARTAGARSTAVPTGGPRGGGDAGPSLKERLAGIPEGERSADVLKLVRATIAAVLAHPEPELIAAQQSFKELGFDSLTTVQLRNHLSRATGLRLPSTLAFDHPTPQDLTDHLLLQLAPQQDATTHHTSTPSTATAGPGEPIAIVGMGCRYPGDINSPDELWSLVSQGRDAIGPFPIDRGWDLARLFDTDADTDRPGTSTVRRGGFLYDADQFDAGFFNISPREAKAIDPQQRLLLEITWQALEDAGIDPTTLAGSQTGVFTGLSPNHYAAHGDTDLEGHLLTGNALAVASGRISYTLGLHGPALSVDTACSSSLVAVHLACQALRNGECDMALAGGATVMATPEVFIEFSRQGGLAPDGRCKAFAANADGTGWAEGAGVIVLQRLSDAQAQGRNILAIIPGSAVNQDGASNGLTAPNGPAQERVIQQALTNARLTPDQVDAVEAHGTGTTLGDPIEAHALLNTYGQHHTAEQPLYLGSLKSNIGHAQAAAGIGGIIKMVQALNHDELPPTLHADQPSPHIDWASGHISLLTKPAPWPDRGRPRNAAVSSFGVSGTNAHVILQQALASTTAEEEAPQAPLGHVALSLSAKTPTALAAQAARLRDHLRDHPDAALAPTAHALAARTLFDHRAVITTNDRDEALTALTSLAENTPHPALITTPTTPTTQTVFLFPGQGCQYPGMGRALYDTHPVFRDALDEVCHALDQHLEHPLRDIIFSHPGTPQATLLDRTDYTQPALFALGTALFHQLTHHHITPDLLIGHSIGEITAAHCAGILTLTDAAHLITTRARLMHTLPP
ncbi:SDR family NAD(P)-dependent oxidoreductase, partial [Streptomyces sp. NPDC048436]|uniref:SDR family NAD(P)-dependent oxidoreductase n=1 Tax=Streptomyces sp. NPDC048436 TaxID=3365550 RepID=UPI003715D363